MNDPIRIGVLGLTHDHIWSNLDELLAVSGGRLVAAADPHEPLLTRFRQVCGRPTYARFDELLDGESLDAVFVFSDNRESEQLACAALARGLAVMVEKPMASSLAGADAMLAAARRSGQRLMVNWPFAWWPQLAAALREVERGAIGQLWQVKYRAAHAGPEELGCSEFFCDWLFDPQRNGGGALMDYCCYGVLLAVRLLGQPSRVSGVAGRLVKEKIVVEDNAILLLAYPRAIAVSEASWTQCDTRSGYQTLLYGTEGTLIVEPRQGGQLLLATRQQPEGQPIEVPPLPPEHSNASAHFVHCLHSGEAFGTLCQDRLCRDVQEVLEAGGRACGDGREVSLPLACADLGTRRISSVEPV